MGREGSDRGTGPGLRRPHYARGGSRSYSASYSTAVVTVAAAPSGGSARSARTRPHVLDARRPLGRERPVRSGWLEA